MRKKVIAMLLTGTMSAGLLAACGSASSTPSDSSSAASATAAATAAADIVPVERLGEGLGYYGLGQALGFAIGPDNSVILRNGVSDRRFSRSVHFNQGKRSSCATNGGNSKREQCSSCPG